jgi:hypothetical protein
VTKTPTAWPRTSCWYWTCTNDETRVSADLRAVHPGPVPRLTRHYSDAILTDGWPTLRAARGKVMFLMDDGGHYRTDYVPVTKRLDGPVRFTNVTPGRPEAAFVKRNDPLRPNTGAIQVGVASEAGRTLGQILSELSPGLVSPEPEHPRLPRLRSRLRSVSPRGSLAKMERQGRADSSSAPPAMLGSISIASNSRIGSFPPRSTRTRPMR